MYEQGTRYYIQVQMGETPAGEPHWQDVTFGDTDQLWRSGRFVSANAELAARREAGDESEYRIVKRTFREEVITPWGWGAETAAPQASEPRFYHIELRTYSDETGEAWERLQYTATLGDDEPSDWRCRSRQTALGEIERQLETSADPYARARLVTPNGDTLEYTAADFENDEDDEDDNDE